MFQKQGDSFELWRLCIGLSHLLVVAATKNRQLIRVETMLEMEVYLAFLGIAGYIGKALCMKKKPWCVSLLCTSASQIDTVAYF